MKKLIILLSIFVIVSIMPNDANFNTNILEKFEPMSAKYLLGTDNLGRDVFRLLIFGFKRTIQTILIASIFSLFLGMGFGFLAGFKGGLWMRILEIIANLGLVVPSFIIALIVSSLMGFNPFSIGISLGVFDFGVYALQVATLTQKIKQEDFINMAIYANVSTVTIFKHHIFNHVFPAVSTLFATKASAIILRYASLAFIGLGADITKPDWGMLLYEYRIYFIERPMLLLWPTLCIFTMCFFFQIFFDSDGVSN